MERQIDANTLEMQQRLRGEEGRGDVSKRSRRARSRDRLSFSFIFLFFLLFSPSPPHAPPSTRRHTQNPSADPRECQTYGGCSNSLPSLKRILYSKVNCAPPPTKVGFVLSIRIMYRHAFAWLEHRKAGYIYIYTVSER